MFLNEIGMKPRERIIRILIKLIRNPYKFTRRDLADEFNEGKLGAIDGDVEALKNANIGFDQESRPPYRMAIIPDHQLKELKHLIPLTEADRAKISRALHQFSSSRDAKYLTNKLESLYDFQKLGLRALRRPALEKIDRLEAGKVNEQQVIIEKYRSNSNTIKDRRVEPYHIDPELDTIQAYDVDEKKNAHFKLSRIDRVIPMDAPWAFKADHRYKYTDVFRMANNDQKLVQLRLDVWGYNALIEQYPKALADISPGANSKTFEFQSKVNGEFLGIIPFIMGNAGHVEILHPAELIAAVKAEAEKILEKLT